MSSDFAQNSLWFKICKRALPSLNINTPIVCRIYKYVPAQKLWPINRSVYYIWPNSLTDSVGSALCADSRPRNSSRTNGGAALNLHTWKYRRKSWIFKMWGRNLGLHALSLWSGRVSLFLVMLFCFGLFGKLGQKTSSRVFQDFRCEISDTSCEIDTDK